MLILEMSLVRLYKFLLHIIGHIWNHILLKYFILFLRLHLRRIFNYFWCIRFGVFFYQSQCSRDTINKQLNESKFIFSEILSLTTTVEIIIIGIGKRDQNQKRLIKEYSSACFVNPSNSLSATLSPVKEGAPRPKCNGRKFINYIAVSKSRSKNASQILDKHPLRLLSS